MHPALQHLSDAAKAVARAIKAAAIFLRDAVVDHFGPAIGTAYNSLHLQDLVRSLITSLGFGSVAGFVGYVGMFFTPFLGGATVSLASVGMAFGALVIDLLRRLGQQSPVPAPATSPWPPRFNPAEM